MSPPDPIMPPPTKRRGRLKPPHQDTLFRVCAAISIGVVLMARGFSVGPMLTADGRASWVCLDRHARPVPGTQYWRRWVLDPRDVEVIPHPSLLAFLYADDTPVPDLSAFGAARAFISSVGERSAKLALFRAQEAGR